MLHGRRRFVACSCLAILASPLMPRAARAQGAASVLAGIAKGLLDAAKNLDKIADGLLKLIAAGDTVGFPVTEAKRVHDRLNDILARSKSLLSANERFATFGKDFIERGPDEGKWKNIQTEVARILERVKGLLADVEKERSDLVRSPLYDAFLKTFQGRVDLLTQLRTLPPPETRAELDAFKLILDNYDKLIASLRKTNAAFAKYLDSGSRPVAPGGGRG